MRGHPAGLRLRLLEAMVAALEPFLASKELTRVVPLRDEGEMHRPAMSLGLLLDGLRALAHPGSGLSDAQRAKAEGLLRRVEEARAARPEEFRAHLERELSSQLRAWARYVEDRDGAPPGGAVAALELDRRTRLARLLDAAGPSARLDAWREPLEAADRRFETATEAGPYAGPEGEAAVYDAARFPWLYRRFPR